MTFASRAGEKLEHALTTFKMNVTGKTCADFGASTGGFVDCLLQSGAAKVYAVETGYGLLDWKLRNDPRVVVMERTNAMHVELPEKVDLISMDTSWTRIENTIGNAIANLKPTGEIIALIKPHYEASPRQLRKGKLPEEHVAEVLADVRETLSKFEVKVLGEVESPIVGSKGGNTEWLMHIKKK
ncbi:MAG: TlyA family rRNA (cytidine-2'-O)-methyltransferase [Candidatus Uhrbacteria bacterium]|nr:TlyA family rRNA (cytidine-2'-O)-methyltransferase [Candidatus Uhrbacteria bacterium]